ncbi:GntR family transcriptional regulator [Roseomonas aerophila]|uniref:GntR family transcriptional regulator n=1 Tax=Teichococcus aerophilus TaxID=1224513 RepID=A0ABR7RMS7_9PROT|nr:GntR family transcriptional regulator [Pseudoroseomonas aerophila]MBC9207417.1 GntR family transcriptional regulator [Pseudoroseomonas aerophila]
MSEDTALHAQAYQALRLALSSGRFAPGQKLTLRTVAADLGVSPMPVREALNRLSAEGALESRDRRSVRVPLLNGAQLRELRDMRMALEGLAAARAAEAATPELVAELRALALGIRAARERGDVAADVRGIRDFHATLYAGAGMPALEAMIASLWLRTGPYVALLFPDYAHRPEHGQGRRRIIDAIARRDAAAARAEIEADIGPALTWLALRLDEGAASKP